MQMLKFLSGLIIFAIACVLQFSLMIGTTLNFVFATLIAFAFIFGFWETLFFILAGVFMINWQPAPSIALIVFATAPLLTYIFRIIFRWETWIGAVVSLFSGFLILYFITAPKFIIVAMPLFLLDLFIGLIFGFLVFFLMHRIFGNSS